MISSDPFDRSESYDSLGTSGTLKSSSSSRRKRNKKTSGEEICSSHRVSKISDSFVEDEESIDNYFITHKNSPYLSPNSSFDTASPNFSPGSLPDTFSDIKRAIHRKNKSTNISEEEYNLNSRLNSSDFFKRKSFSAPKELKIIYIGFIYNGEEKFYPISSSLKLKELELIISIEYQKRMNLKLPNSDYILKTNSDFQRVIKESNIDYIRLVVVPEKKKKKDKK